MSKVNMQVRSKSADAVKSGTTIVKVVPCGKDKKKGNSRRKRSSGSVSFETEMPVAEVKPLIDVNATPTAYDMLFHSFNVRPHVAPFTFNIFPNDTNSTYAVYIKYEAQPTPTSYDFMFILPKNASNETDASLSAEDEHTLLHTIMIGKENLTNGTYRLGIKHYGE